MLNFTNVKTLTIPEGKVKKITRKSDGVVLWEKVSKPSFTNVLPLAQQYSSTAPYIGADGSVGYGNNMRISTSSPSTTYMKALNGVDTTAMIPVKRGDVLRFKNCNFKVTPSNTSYGTHLYGFDSDKAIMQTFNGLYYSIPNRFRYVVKDDEYVELTLEPTDAWLAVSSAVSDAFDKLAYIMISTDGLDETSIITVNEQITSTYTNLVPLSTEADGKTIYNGGLGYKKGYRIRSGGAEAAGAECVCTGFIPFVKGDKLYIYPAFTGKNANNAINFANASFTNLGQIVDSGFGYGICSNHVEAFKTKVVNGVSVLDLSSNTASGVDDIAFVRITNDFYAASGSEMIITKNEEITL